MELTFPYSENKMVANHRTWLFAFYKARMREKFFVSPFLFFPIASHALFGVDAVVLPSSGEGLEVLYSTCADMLGARLGKCASQAVEVEK